MSREAILETYSKAATERDPGLCCPVDYQQEFSPEELQHIPEEVLKFNYGCGIPPELRRLEPGKSVLDLGPGLGRDCFIAARKVGPEGQVFGLDMSDEMLQKAERYKQTVVSRLGYDNLRFLKGQFDVQIPLEDSSIDVIFSNCVNNLALEKKTAYQEMLRILRPGSKLSFSDIVSYEPLPAKLRVNETAWADCVAGALCFQDLNQLLSEIGFQGVTLKTDYLWQKGTQIVERYFPTTSLKPEELETITSVRLYSVTVEAYKPILDPNGPCYWKGHYALYDGPAKAYHLDPDPDHVFPAGVSMEVCEKTATVLKNKPHSSYFTVFEPEGEVEARLCVPGSECC